MVPVGLLLQAASPVVTSTNSQPRLAVCSSNAVTALVVVGLHAVVYRT